MTGTLILVFDVNFLQAGAAAAMQTFIDNLIAYLGVPVSLPGTDLNLTTTSTFAAPNLTYTFTVTNNGPSDATAVALSDAMPANTTFVSYTAPAGWTITVPAVGVRGTFTATRPTLTVADGAQVITLTLRVASGLPADASISNTASLGSATRDTVSTNNSATVATPVGEPVPTMGEWGMILMTLLLAMTGAFVLKRRHAEARLA
jgi:uncharacterized repeat protein (TIGR01451 family)